MVQCGPGLTWVPSVVQCAPVRPSVAQCGPVWPSVAQCKPGVERPSVAQCCQCDPVWTNGPQSVFPGMARFGLGVARRNEVIDEAVWSGLS